jgi:hypothetical protein
MAQNCHHIEQIDRSNLNEFAGSARLASLLQVDIMTAPQSAK